MSDVIQTVRVQLLASSAVATLVSDRIYPMMHKDQTFPAIVLERASVIPLTHLTGDAGLDRVEVRLESWAESYEEARRLAEACRTALIAADILMLSESELFDPETQLSGSYCITQEFAVWS